MTKARRRPSRPVDPWSGIDPDNRPTPERRKHGDIRPVEFSQKGPGRMNGKVAIDFAATPVLRAYGRGYLTAMEKGAADRLERLWRASHGGTRDSLDMSPRGHDEQSDRAAERQASVRNELKRARTQMHSWEWTATVGVCCEHWAFGSYSGRRFLKVKAGLRKLVEFWKITA